MRKLRVPVKDKKLIEFFKKGERKGSYNDFFELLRRASKPLKK